MRLIARSTLISFAVEHPESRPSLEQWQRQVKGARWRTVSEFQASFPKAKVLDAERVRFEIAGGNYRLVVALDFARAVAYVKFIGTHKQYDAVDPFTVSQF